MVMGLFKKAGAPAWEQRHLTLHGSSPRRGMAKHAGQLRRLNEKPVTSKPRGKRR